ncbi:MAG: hypothetical protein GY792_10165 [Gammaproteobacteria bacterium]|nr:hypothetical protein [Gammaproteobacteria bacterium]
MKRLLYAVVILALAVSSAYAQDHHGWSRSELISKFEELSVGDDLNVEAVRELPKNLFLLDPTEDSACFFRPGERLEALNVGDFSTILLISDHERTHTLWFYFPIVNVRDTDKAFAFYSDILRYLFPSWQGAESWAKDSLAASWGASARAYEDPMISLEEMIARQTTNGAALATTGFPPDLVTYRITSRPACEHVSDFLLAKPRQAERNPTKRNPDQESAGLQLYYSRPAPIDISSTPIFLGQVQGIQERNSTEKSIKLSALGPLAGVAVDLDEWLDTQANFPIADGIWSAIEDGWGYERNFLFLITRPILPLVESNDRNILLVNKTIGDIHQTTKGDRVVRWERFSGLLFGTEMKPQQDDRSAERSKITVGPNVVWFLNEGVPVPVDVSDTPIYLGSLRQMYDANGLDLPQPLHADIEAMTLKIADKQGNVTYLDLSSWIHSQNGEPMASIRPQPISQPTISFELGGRSHRLVISSLSYSVSKDALKAVSGLTGQFFAAR